MALFSKNRPLILTKPANCCIIFLLTTKHNSQGRWEIIPGCDWCKMQYHVPWWETT